MPSDAPRLGRNASNGGRAGRISDKARSDGSRAPGVGPISRHDDQGIDAARRTGTMAVRRGPLAWFGAIYIGAPTWT